MSMDRENNCKRIVWTKKSIIIVFVINILMLSACARTEIQESKSETSQESEIPSESSKSEKGYDLPITEAERAEAEQDCNEKMELLRAYGNGEDSASEDMMQQMEDIIAETGCPVTEISIYANMQNYEKMDTFLNNMEEGKEQSIVLYKICLDGGIGREKYVFDGSQFYIIAANASWVDRKAKMIYIAKTNITEWTYTRKGWFCYELCVPEPPEVTEVVNGTCMIRILPISDSYRELSQKYLLPISYQGNNLLQTDWDKDHMDTVDLNGAFPFLYQMKYQKSFEPKDYPDGVPFDIVEGTFLQYLPVSTEQIQEIPGYDAAHQVFAASKLCRLNYAPSTFGTSIPEVVDVKENKDGTMTLSVDAVCEMMVGNETAMEHEVMIEIKEDGEFQYLGNKILEDGSERIPEYQYRIQEQ